MHRVVRRGGCPDEAPPSKPGVIARELLELKIYSSAPRRADIEPEVTRQEWIDAVEAGIVSMPPPTPMAREDDVDSTG
jgi:hypothetical protein